MNKETMIALASFALGAVINMVIVLAVGVSFMTLGICVRTLLEVVFGSILSYVILVIICGKACDVLYGVDRNGRK